jgi:hypothetical protein
LPDANTWRTSTPWAILLGQVTWPFEENVCPMLPKTSTPPLNERDILHHAKLGAPQVFFITPCQVSMTKEKDYAWVILLIQVNMVILGECLPDATHLSITLDKGLVRMSTICSSVDMYWSFTAPFCTMSRMKSCKKLLKPHCFTTCDTSCDILCL